jgi:hypothetical protein
MCRIEFLHTSYVPPHAGLTIDSSSPSQAAKLDANVEASDSDTSDEESARDENGVRIRKPKEGQAGVSEVYLTCLAHVCE